MIFKNDKVWSVEDTKEPSIVCEEGNEITLNEDEKEVLKLGPKFCVMGRLDDEKFEIEVEQMIMKVKWDIIGKEEKLKKKTLADIAIDSILDEDEIRECEEYEEIQEAKTRMIYDQEQNTLYFSKRRTTNFKK